MKFKMLIVIGLYLFFHSSCAHSYDVKRDGGVELFLIPNKDADEKYLEKDAEVIKQRILIYNQFDPQVDYDPQYHQIHIQLPLAESSARYKQLLEMNSDFKMRFSLTPEYIDIISQFLEDSIKIAGNDNRTYLPAYCVGDFPIQDTARVNQLLKNEELKSRINFPFETHWGKSRIGDKLTLMASGKRAPMIDESNVRAVQYRDGTSEGAQLQFLVDKKGTKAIQQLSSNREIPILTIFNNQVEMIFFSDETISSDVFSLFGNFSLELIRVYYALLMTDDIHHSYSSAKTILHPIRKK